MALWWKAQQGWRPWVKWADQTSRPEGYCVTENRETTEKSHLLITTSDLSETVSHGSKRKGDGGAVGPIKHCWSRWHWETKSLRIKKHNLLVIYSTPSGLQPTGWCQWDLGLIWGGKKMLRSRFSGGDTQLVCVIKSIKNNEILQNWRLLLSTSDFFHLKSLFSYSVHLSKPIITHRSAVFYEA